MNNQFFCKKISPLVLVTAWVLIVFLLVFHTLAWANDTTSFNAIMSKIGADQAEYSEQIVIKAPEIAENGMVVPITVSTTIKGASTIYLLVKNNPSPFVASFSLSEQTLPLIKTRIKMSKSSDIVVVVKAGAKIYQAKKLVRVTLAGCGGDYVAESPYRMYVNPLSTVSLQQNSDQFPAIETTPFIFTKTNPVSTFSIDVDTAAYSFMRAAIQQNTLPEKDVVRIEELINYFPYHYPTPKESKHPFQTTTTVMPTPWNVDTKLLHIGIKGYQLPKQTQPKSNLVFLLDTSGSMDEANKLPLLKNAFKLLLSSLQPSDTVAIVAYAGSAGVVLEPTNVKHKQTIIQALERLDAGGSTAGGKGIDLAYQLAEANYDKNAVNRVILATDGDFNVGLSTPEALKSFIERKRQSGVFLSVLGFGMGNYHDELMQTLAQQGNGNAAYIDSLSEARKVLVEEASSTLFTIAKDVKIQLEFNPNVVSQYRLIGYETRRLNREDFNNDKVDAGDIGAGHTVTAIYELTLVGSKNEYIDPLRYTEKMPKTEIFAVDTDEKQREYGFLKLRYKLPNEDKSQLIETPIHIAETADNINAVSSEIRFATAVAAFGQLLRSGTYTGSYDYDDVIKLAQTAKGEDLFGYRAEFMNLVRLAKTIN